MPIYGRKDKKLRRATAKKREYLKANKHRIERGDRGTPTMAQWESSSATEKGLMASGLSHKKVSSLKRRKK